jgi:hypothetical protein
LVLALLCVPRLWAQEPQADAVLKSCFQQDTPIHKAPERAPDGLCHRAYQEAQKQRLSTVFEIVVDGEASVRLFQAASTA